MNHNMPESSEFLRTWMLGGSRTHREVLVETIMLSIHSLEKAGSVTPNEGALYVFLILGISNRPRMRSSFPHPSLNHSECRSVPLPIYTLPVENVGIKLLF